MKKSANRSSAQKKATARSVGPGFIEVTRTIPAPVERLLWGRAAGRCEFSGCNDPLWKSLVTQETVNVAQKAHIYAFSSDGPRGNKGISKKDLNSIENLMLVCHRCHRKIDQHKDGGRYTAALLKEWKAEHERRIEIVTGINPSKKSHVVLYGANIGQHNSPLNFAACAHALFPNLYPADAAAIQLGSIDNSITDDDQEFWRENARQLVTRFNQRVKDRLASGAIDHLSIFAIAPQPLLILLGSLMADITNAEVFQRHREPQTWRWPDPSRALEFEVQEPSKKTGTPALVLSLSAPVTDDRITSVLGGDASIWKVTVRSPNTDLIKSRAHLSEFRQTIRPLLDRIQAEHGQTTLHVFPVAGVSAAVELGRVRMPKAHMPWQLYDHVNSRGGFIPALLLPFGA
jgi:hypothetical protein